MKRVMNPLAFLAVILFLSSCTVVRQGEVGVKRTLGKIRPEPLREGVKVFKKGRPEPQISKYDCLCLPKKVLRCSQMCLFYIEWWAVRPHR